MNQSVGSNQLNTKTVRSSSTNSDSVETGIFNSLNSDLVKTSSKQLSISNIVMSPISRANHSNSSQANGRKINSTSTSFDQGKISCDPCVVNHLSKRISNKQQRQKHLTSSHQSDIDLFSHYQLSSTLFKHYFGQQRGFFPLDFFIRIEQLPDIWTFDPANGETSEINDEDKKVKSLSSLKISYPIFFQ